MDNWESIFICAYPRNDQYCNKFYGELEKYKIYAFEGQYSIKWLYRNRRRFKIVHFHWPSFYYRRKKILSFLNFFLFLFLIRFLKKKIVWTAHNLYPHNVKRIHILDYLSRLMVIFFAKLIFVHGITARQTLIKEFPIIKIKNICTIDHGNYLGYLPNYINFKQARKTLNIPNSAFVYLHFGRARAYKGIEDLIDAFSLSSNRNDILLLVGKFPDKKYLYKIKNIVKEKRKLRGKITLVDKRIDDKSIQIYMNASNVIVLPYKYKSSLTSGIAMISLSFGLPIVAPRIGHLNDLIDDKNGLLFDQGISAYELSEYLLKVKNRQYDRANSIKKIEKYSWKFIGSKASKCLIKLSTVVN